MALTAAVACAGCTGDTLDPMAGPDGPGHAPGDGPPGGDAGGGGSTTGTTAGDAAPPTSSETGATSQELAEGATLYAGHCEACHGNDGRGTPFGAPLTRDMGLETLISTIDMRMPQNDPQACEGECARLVGLYVRETFVLGDAAEPMRCDAEQPSPRQLRLLTRQEYQNTVGDLLGITPPDVSSLPVEGRVAGFNNNAKAAVVTSRHADGYMLLAEELAERTLAENRGILGCGDMGCSERLVRDFGKRVFRRPLSDDEVERYHALFDAELTQGSFDEGARLMLTAMLVSPHFLYRSEVGNGAGGGAYSLTPHETASALSYLFWGTMPDQTLMAAADADQLQTPEQLREQAERLLADPRAEPQLQRFATQWLRSEGTLSANKDKDVYPGFTDAVREALMAEQQRFFSHLFLETDGRFADLYRADYLFLNSTLAAFYGLDDPGTGETLARVDAPAGSGRGGILGLGAVMASHAHQNESSPIKRGLFVRDRLLCQPLPDPPPDLDTTPPGLDPTLTTRERFAIHTEADACRSCHKYIDGVGFGLEGFDGVGARREMENGLPIDESGELLGLESLEQDTVEPFEGPDELSDLLAGSENAQRCLARQYFRFASGRKERVADLCSVQRLGDLFIESELALSELLVLVTQLDNFKLRQDATP